jgi:uncharacterized protein YqjF (DUF2071 family)
LTTRRAFLTAEWRYLVMLNYEIDPGVLEPLVPAGTTLDRWAGRALVSVVGFRFLRTRVLGVPIPLHRDFDEVNLRFYVRHETTDGAVRRGVTFVRELVPRAAIALVARVAYDEPYRAVRMRSTAPAAPTERPGTVEYAWRTGGRWQRVAAMATGVATVPAPDDEATFVTEHYWGYTRRRSGATTEYEVAHPRWRVWTARDAVLDADVRGLYGAPFVDALAGPPRSAFIADGSAVTVYRPRSLGPAPGRSAR